jgi:hypothetical protein
MGHLMVMKVAFGVDNQSLLFLMSNHSVMVWDRRPH